MPIPEQATYEQTERPGTLRFLDDERKAHAAAAASRCVAYVERSNQLRALDEFLRHDSELAGGNVLIVHGASGSGKSALLAYWCAQRSRLPEHEFIVSHFIGATASSTDHVDLIRRVILEIRERCQLREELPTGRMNTEDGLPRWLGFVQSEDLILIIDGLDQLAPGSCDLAWLPSYIQPRVHLLLSSNDATQVAMLCERGAQDLEIQPLTRSDRLAIARRHISVRGARLSRADIRRVAAAPASANPLFLRTSLEEARAYAERNDGEQWVDYYLAASGLEDLYSRMLARVEDEHGASLVGNVLGLIMASRRGLTSDELGQMTEDYIGVVALAKRLEFFLVERSGCLSLLHQELRNAVISRYAPNADLTVALHRRLANFFLERTTSDRSIDEVAWQLSRSGDHQRLTQFLSDLAAFHAIYSHDEGLELMGYMLQLGDHFDTGTVYVSAFGELIESGTDLERIAAIGTELGAFLQAGGSVGSAVSVLERLVTTLADRCSGLSLQRSRALTRLGIAQQSLGEMSSAELAFVSARKLLDESPAASSTDQIRLRSAQVDLLYARSQFAEAESVLREALAISTENYGADHPMTAEVLADLGAVLLKQGDVGQAEDVLRSALVVAERAYGSDHPLTAQAVNNLASVLRERDADAALALFVRVGESYRRTLGPLSAAYAAARINIGLLRKKRGDFVEAERDYREALDVLVSTGRDQSLDAASILFNLGVLFDDMGRREEARSELFECYRLRERLLGEDNVKTIDVLTRMMHMEWQSGNFERAEDVCRMRIDRLRKLYGEDSDQLVRPLRELSDILARAESTRTRRGQ